MTKSKKPKKLGVHYFCRKVMIPGTPGTNKREIADFATIPMIKFNNMDGNCTKVIFLVL